MGDAQDLPFPNACFDAVVNFGIIHHVLDWRRCISELSRVTQPGGAFYFEEIYPPLYANFLLKRMVRHPTSDRFMELSSSKLSNIIDFSLQKGFAQNHDSESWARLRVEKLPQGQDSRSYLLVLTG